MKGDKKILAVAILLLLISVGFTTYAIYKTSTTATGSVKLSDWIVKINDTNLESVTTITVDLSSCTGTHNGKNNTMAPGDSCSITIPVNATGSEVDVKVDASLGTVTGLPTGMTVDFHTGSASQTITYNASSMTADVVIDVAWPTSTTSVENTYAGTTVSIPVTLTASQASYN